jgi:VanZ family protein
MNRKSISEFFLYNLPPFIYAALVFYLSSLPSWKIKAVSSIPDYILHFTEYAVFAWLSIRFAKNITKGTITGKTFTMTIIILALFAFSDEWHQSFVPGRFASVLDFVVDLAGILAGVGIYVLFLRYRMIERRLTRFSRSVDKK